MQAFAALLSVVHMAELAILLMGGCARVSNRKLTRRQEWKGPKLLFASAK